MELFAFDPLLVILGGLAAAAIMAVAFFWRSLSTVFRPAAKPAAAETVSFLFDQDSLLDVSDAGAALARDAHEFRDIAAQLTQRFPDLPRSLNEITTDRTISSGLPGDAGQLEFRKAADRTTVVLHDPEINASDRHKLLSTQSRLEHLDAVVHEAPVVIWSVRRTGEVVDHNAYYASLQDRAGGEPFELDFDATDQGRGPRRKSLIDQATDTKHWYDITSKKTGPDTVTHYAVNADAVVNAEVAQRNFVQTLTKTFAQLSIGLAIFDRNRQLALFNPALIDLTTVPADLLSARPSLNRFFDQLRDRQIMPEPRNYRNWRDQLSDMIAAARDGVYCETWTLPSGLTYRISGKPHPDGAVAFLFEDISAEISLTRRFRAELELSQSVIDALDSAVAVFSRSGALTFCNARFREMWKCSPDESFIEMTILDMSRIWQENCVPSPVWGELRDFVTTIEDRGDWSDEVTHNDEGRLAIDATPLTGGTSLVRFSQVQSAKQPASEDAV